MEAKTAAESIVERFDAMTPAEHVAGIEAARRRVRSRDTHGLRIDWVNECIGCRCGWGSITPIGVRERRPEVSESDFDAHMREVWG